MYQRTGECKLLFHAPGESAGATFPERLYLLVYRLYKVVVLPDGCPEDGCIKLQVLLYGQIRIEAETAGHVTDMITQLPEVTYHIESEKGHPAS